MSDILGRNRFMRILVFFDLPVKKKMDRDNYTKFRRNLIKDGFCMIQYSVYCRVCSCPEMAEKHVNKVKTFLPAKGSVRVLTVTDRQYSSMIILLGKKTSNEWIDKKMIEGQGMLI
ncbi:CRISPR-associated endonuclease Cas2 [Ruminiclostridium cellulolyticum]|uniref:CRISPR-associated endoribonuclease Cas2 n=1 Tax=Ruminiclostridium cellulolyticum (strain ATCC 35319 / DSM 5812 / JCM 6584 / H10) TaxID=394503 RepID=B8I083_RUMCH|nr:CRISPR-associated endonuclease Cas2 [Ruminiclostridium cellulolyticum]ACL77409.1 CRISPR-associated protein Cas2 [Ruminiclostridium cellulolyticum H10]